MNEESASYLDIKYHQISDIFFMNNQNRKEIDCFGAKFVKKDGSLEEFSLIPLSEMIHQQNRWISENEKKRRTDTIQFFEKTDKDFEVFLGINKCPSETEAINRIDELLTKEKDNMHKYYLICTKDEVPFGIFYFYDFKQAYMTCNLSIGLLSEKRGNGYCFEIMNILCHYIMSFGMNRIGLEVETTNTKCLKVCEEALNQIGFQFEGVRKNSYGVGVDSAVFAWYLHE